MADRFLAEQGLDRYQGSDREERLASKATRELKLMDEVSTYATTNDRELAAEAFADVMENGDEASLLSRVIADAIDDKADRERIS